jgi:hypothetical protein
MYVDGTANRRSSGSVYRSGNECWSDGERHEWSDGERHECKHECDGEGDACGEEYGGCDELVGECGRADEYGGIDYREMNGVHGGSGFPAIWIRDGLSIAIWTDEREGLSIVIWTDERERLSIAIWTDEREGLSIATWTDEREILPENFHRCPNKHSGFTHIM